MAHPGFAALMDLAAGRELKAAATHVIECAACRAALAEARILIASGRRATMAPKPSRSARRRALRVFRDHFATGRRGFVVAIDSWLRPALAVRGAATDQTRYLKFDGPVTIELYLTRVSRGWRVLGHVTPWVPVAKDGDALKVGADGRFSVGIVRGAFTLEVEGETLSVEP